MNNIEIATAVLSGAAICISGFTVYCSIHYGHQSKVHSQASQWYLSRSPGDEKPDYVLESERLRRKS